MSILIDGTSGITPLAFSSNLQFTSTGQRILGDFSNAIVANRVAFQTSTANGATSIYILPNGTSPTSQFVAVNNSDPTNASVLQLQVNATDYQIRGGITGTGTYLPMTFYTGGSERMRIDTSGNVGIGTSSPPAGVRLDAFGGYFRLRSNTTINADISGNVNALVFESSGGTGEHAIIAGGNTSQNFLSFYTANTAAPAERMRIDSSGNVLVGTTSNTSTVGTAIRYGYDAASTIFVGKNNSPASSNWMEFAGGGATRAVLAWDTSGGGAYFGSTTAYPVSFYTNNTERMRIDSSGNVGIGTSSPSTKLQVNGCAAIQGSGSPSSGSGLELKYDGTRSVVLSYNRTGSAYLPLWTDGLEHLWYVSGSERMRITSGGEVYIAGTTDQGAYNLQCNGTGVWGAGAYVNGSDARLKEEVADIQSGLDVVAAMRPVTFRYKEDYSKDQSTQPGFIAQELQAAMEGKNYVDGVVQSGPEYLNVAYQNLIPILTKAIQELKSELDELKAKVQ